MRAGPVNCQILLGGERDRTGPLAGVSRAYANAYTTGTGAAKRARSTGSTEHRAWRRTILNWVLLLIRPGLVFVATQRITYTIKQPYMNARPLYGALFHAGVRSSACYQIAVSFIAFSPYLLLALTEPLFISQAARATPRHAI
ncbi:hypothetical protein GGI35DRAFT_441106 [Trichoderma velutinum]